MLASASASSSGIRWRCSFSLPGASRTASGWPSASTARWKRLPALPRSVRATFSPPFLRRPARHRRSPATSRAARPLPAARAGRRSPGRRGRAATTPPAGGGRSRRSGGRARGRAPAARACRCRARRGSPPGTGGGRTGPGPGSGSGGAGRSGSAPAAPTFDRRRATSRAPSVPDASDVDEQMSFSWGRASPPGRGSLLNLRQVPVPKTVLGPGRLQGQSPFGDSPLRLGRRSLPTLAGMRRFAALVLLLPLVAGCSSSGSKKIVIQPAKMYRLAGFQPAGSTTPGRPTTVAFTVNQPSGSPLTAYRTGAGPHTGIHLIIVSDDLSTIIHRHPPMQPGGRFRQQVVFPAPGRYRVIVDVYPKQQRPLPNFQLFNDVQVRGVPRPQPLGSYHVVQHIGGFTFTAPRRPNVRAIQATLMTVHVTDAAGKP